MDHLVGLLWRAVGSLEQCPDVVEQVLAEPPVILRVEIMGRQVIADDCFGHERFLSLAELADDVVDTLEAVDARLDPGTLRAEQPQAFRRIVGGKDGPDRLEWDLEIAQPADGTGGVELIPPIAPVAGESINLGRREEPGFVVMAQGADAQSAEPREAPDRKEVVHPRIVDPRVTRESRAARFLP